MPWYSTKRATTVTKVGDLNVCTYHRTAVVQWNDERIILDSGGFETVTTKRRMNEVSEHYGLGFTVYQSDFTWYVRLSDGTTVPFTDKMEIKR